MTSIAYGPAILFTKLAILCLYRRVFLTHRWGVFDWVLRIFTSVLCLFYLTTTIAKIWQCSPRRKIWDKDIPGSCIDIPALLQTSGAFNTITDILILLVPVKFVWNLQMTKKTKLFIVLIFTVGLT